MVNIPANNQEYDSILKLSGRALGNALMRITNEKPGISEILHQDVLSARLKRGILDLPIKTTYDLVIAYEFHSGFINENTVIRNYQYAIDLRVEVDVPVRPHFVSIDSNKTPIPKVELFPGFYTDPKVTYLSDFPGEKILNTIKNKLNNQVELDDMDVYCLALMPFFSHEKSRKDVLTSMSYFINEIEISEEFKYLIKLIQILSANAMFVDDELEEILGVIKMGNTYIEKYEKNLINTAIKEIALKMKDDGVSSDFIFKYFGIKL